MICKKISLNNGNDKPQIHRDHFFWGAGRQVGKEGVGLHNRNWNHCILVMFNFLSWAAAYLHRPYFLL